MSMTATKPRATGGPDYLTTPQIADALSSTLSRVHYATLKHRLDPDLVAGRCRLYRADRLDEFAAALGLGAEADPEAARRIG